jgi:hypothetical protein
MTHGHNCLCPSCAAYSIARALLVGSPYDAWLDGLEETPTNPTPRPDDLVSLQDMCGKLLGFPKRSKTD